MVRVTTRLSYLLVRKRRDEMVSIFNHYGRDCHDQHERRNLRSQVHDPSFISSQPKFRPGK